MHRLPGLVLAIAALGLLLTGCSDDEKDPGPALAATSTSTSAAPLTTAAASTTSAAATTVASTTASAPTATVQLARFQTPTGNIACDSSGGGIRCDILEKSWTPPPRPADCDLDWGTGLSITPEGSPRFVCAGDTVADPALPRLAYDTTTRAGGITCVSRQDGLTCTSDRTRRGFFLSRARYALI